MPTHARPIHDRRVTSVPVFRDVVLRSIQKRTRAIVTHGFPTTSYERISVKLRNFETPTTLVDAWEE